MISLQKQHSKIKLLLILEIIYSAIMINSHQEVSSSTNWSNTVTFSKWDSRDPFENLTEPAIAVLASNTFHLLTEIIPTGI